MGSNSTLVAPITVESGGFVAAGSTVTNDVGADQLSVARGRQRNIDGWKRPTRPEEPTDVRRVAVTARRDCSEILLEGLRRLEYGGMTPRDLL